jgi:hypothetical protein
MLRCCSKTGDHEVHKPPNTDANGAANTVQGNFLAEQALHPGALVYLNHPVSGRQDKLAATVLALMILLASVNMAIFRYSPARSK